MNALNNPKFRRTTPVLASLIVASLASLQAQEADDSSPFYKNRFGISYRAAFNVRANFTHLGAMPSLSNPGPGVGVPDQQHRYDDGYVLPDSTAGDGYTWNWGYQNASQVPPPGDQIINFHSSQSQGNGSLNDVTSDPQHGMEITYERWLYRTASEDWGVLLAFNYAHVGIKTDRGATGTAMQTTDSYGLNGVTPPLPGYMGTFMGPGTLINDSPTTRTVTSVPMSVSGRDEIDADVFGLRLGPYFDAKLSRRLTFNLSGGFAMAVVNSRFRYSESVSVPGVLLGSSSGSDTESDVLVGAYVSGTFSYALSRQWALTLGAEYQALGDFKQSVNGREAKLDFSTGVYLKGGVSFSF